MRIAAAASSLLLTSLLARGARADEPRRENGPAYELVPEFDVPALAIATVVSSAWLLRGELAGPYCAPVCDRGTLLGIDRWAAGRYDRGWATVSDVGVATMIAGSAVVLVAAEGLRDGLNDEVVVLEAQLVSNALSVVSNMGVRRPRPYAYGDTAPLDARDNGDAAMSFFSGHTAASTALTFAMFRTLRRLNRPILPWVVLGVCSAGAALIGTSRVLAGDHFPTDVLAGAVVGTADGFLIPALHRAPVRVIPAPATGSGTLFLMGAF